MRSRRLAVKIHEYHGLVGALAHIYLVNHFETKDTMLNGHISPASAKAENDDSDEDKDEDGGNIDAGAPGSKLLHDLVEANG